MGAQKIELPSLLDGGSQESKEKDEETDEVRNGPLKMSFGSGI